jgi:transcriptional regulator with XRE-family HTH domain
MDDQRVGAAFRAVRIRRGWRQSDLARRAQISAATLSAIEHGHLDDVSTRALRRAAAALDIRLEVTLRLPHGELDRLLNAGHSALHEMLAQYLSALPGWIHAPEVSFAVYGERGVIDILAFHSPTGSLLIIELKTELVSLEDLLGTMDVRLRHARSIARERGWAASSVSAWVVIADTDVNKRRVRAHSAVLRSAFPADGHAIRSWLRNPHGTIRALSLWANFSRANASAVTAVRRRVRKRCPAAVAGTTRGTYQVGTH